MIAYETVHNKLMQGDLLPMSEIKQQVALLAQHQAAEAKRHLEVIILLGDYIKEHNLAFDDATTSFISSPHVNMLVENESAHGFVVQSQPFEALEEFQKLYLCMHYNLLKLHRYSDAMHANRLKLLQQMLQKLEGYDLTSLYTQLAPIKDEIRKFK